MLPEPQCSALCSSDNVFIRGVPFCGLKLCICGLLRVIFLKHRLVIYLKAARDEFGSGIFPCFAEYAAKTCFQDNLEVIFELHVVPVKQ